MGKLAEALDGASLGDVRPTWHIPCKFGKWFESLDEEDKAAVRRLLESGETNVDVAKRLSLVGHPVSNVTISRHRNEGCVQCHVLQTI